MILEITTLNMVLDNEHVVTTGRSPFDFLLEAARGRNGRSERI